MGLLDEITQSETLEVLICGAIGSKRWENRCFHDAVDWF